MLEEVRLRGADIPAMGMAVVICDENRVARGFALVEVGDDGENRLRNPTGEPLPKMSPGWSIKECRYNHEDGRFYPPLPQEHLA